MDQLLILFTTPDNAPEAALVAGQWFYAEPGETMKHFLERVDAQTARERTTQ